MWATEPDHAGRSHSLVRRRSGGKHMIAVGMRALGRAGALTHQTRYRHALAAILRLRTTGDGDERKRQNRRDKSPHGVMLPSH